MVTRRLPKRCVCVYYYFVHIKSSNQNIPDKIKVTVNALHPGLVDTGLLTRLDPTIKSQAIPISEGVKTPLYLATSPEVERVSGKYFFEEKPINSSDISYSQEEADKMWEHSMQCVAHFLPSSSQT